MPRWCLAVVDPTAAAGIAILGLLYVRGRSGFGTAAYRDWAFAGAMVALAVALVSPLDAAVDRSLTLHMVQHVILIALAAPLLALASPIPVLFAGLGLAGFLARIAARNPIATGRWTARAVVAALVQAAVMWLWHAPPLFEAALHAPVLHAAEHLTLLLSAAVAWWALFSVPRRLRGGATLVSCLAAFPGTALGAALLLAPRPWYPTYAARPGALGDQQLAGVVMWSFGGITYLIVAVGLFASWLSSPAGTPAFEVG